MAFKRSMMGSKRSEKKGLRAAREPEGASEENAPEKAQEGGGEGGLEVGPDLARGEEVQEGQKDLVGWGGIKGVDKA